ncbi:hypothetical protein NDU88_003798 [Pleurodeles waltl]|uniref:Sulfhydryl oxidase n=1 Tax=Pleurodeles waltl TaxID=8319 RepID=A0AAV7T771_PLEWA|nr:hypothetical protein NDU88_003798 [Pleurodeles waltl]
MMPEMRVLWLLWALWAPAWAGLYSREDPLVVLDSDSAPTFLLNSSSAWFAEFYASWCGHCQNFAPTWKQLALDVQDWRPAIYLAVLDCAMYSRGCTNFDVTAYPTLKFFKAFSADVSSGKRVKGLGTATQLRRKIIDNLEEHKESWPPACPPLEPASVTEIQGFFNSNNVEYLALIFEDERSYVGREVTLDMLQFDNLAVRRVLPGEALQLPHFGVKSFPSAYLIQKTGTFSRIRVRKEDRLSYRNFLRSLRGVRRGTFQLLGQKQTSDEKETIVWRQADSSKVYMADLESALHYTLRVEVAKFPVLDGDKLTALKKYVHVLAKFFPARPFVKNLLLAMDSWLQNVTENQISYSDFENVLNNRGSGLEAVLMANTTWVWCQGSEPQFRGFPCSLWTLFHVLTAQSVRSDGRPVQDEDAVDILGAMRSYVKNFFGCEECAKHFEGMASKSMGNVSTQDEAIEWLWDRHNKVNARLAGEKSEDPRFPKLQWPTPDLCPLCQREKDGELYWDVSEVRHYLKAHYGKENIVNDYLEDEQELLKRQRLAEGEALEKPEVGQDSPAPMETRERRDVAKTEVEEMDENNEDMLENRGMVNEMHQVRKHNKRPTIIRLSAKSKSEDTAIVDLDSFIDEHYKQKAVQSARRKRSASERGLQSHRLEEDLLPDVDSAAVHERLRKRGAGSKHLNGILVEEGYPKGPVSQRRWFRVIDLGFSRLDLSLCIVLYLLSSICLLSMYLYFHMKKRCWKQRAGFPSA